MASTGRRSTRTAWVRRPSDRNRACIWWRRRCWRIWRNSRYCPDYSATRRRRVRTCRFLPRYQKRWGFPRGEEEVSSSTKLVIVGHSLGGGAAVLMSLFLQRDYPNTCCCFDPPGETLSPGLRELSTHFCTTTVFGHDIFPRVSSYRLSLLQFNVFASLAHCRWSKARYFLDVLLRRVTMESAFADEIASEEVGRSLNAWLEQVGEDGV